MNTPERWTQERCDQLNALERLLTDIAGLNSTTNAIGMLQACMESAAALRKWDVEGPESFVGFLRGLAVADRERQRAARASGEQQLPQGDAR